MKNLVLIPFLLGMINEYQCRTVIENGQDVEFFYESNREQARVFFNHANEVLEQNHIKETVRVSVDESSGGITLSNEYLSDTINGFYAGSYANEYFYDEKNHPHRMRSVCLNWSSVKDLSKEEKLSFVEGVYLDNSKGNCLYNAPHKLEIVKTILSEFGYKKLKIKTLCKECVPQGHELCLSNDPESIVQQSEEILRNAKDELFYESRWGKKSSLFLKE